MLISGLVVLTATSAPQPAQIDSRGPDDKGETDASGRAQLVVTMNAAALGSTDASDLVVTAHAITPIEGDPGETPPPGGTMKQRGTKTAHPFQADDGKLTVRLGSVHQTCGEVDDDDDPDCVIVFDVELDVPSVVQAALILTSNSSPGFPFSGNGSFPEEARITVEVR